MILSVLSTKLDAFHKKHRFLATNPIRLCYTKKNVNLCHVAAKAFWLLFKQ